ncbi:TonB-dependent siderophore receptor [Neisseria meningitidis]|uniref:TonB-dependent siderophore receptor n=1 Tax=Neisseria meningitidis TaxID=487 RepID=UPI001C59F27A|nr:TonB-dependent siderophore receptor [Neisseria meningitidis]MBW3907640.1 TonB-dependent siderophore receptor [Neisseria meningitidis]MBW3936141.1 TonB-dependent siderophore receptor [Neisseria meningitidis]MBW3992930.1 TonB-dependent siderophore receptor [Neisseria meningitidis]MBW4011370.1 TonB-dependent siderophore receptor [Neisseria meningitidis]MCG3362182.1 TonB-dependent siderophore receptor [Neisseria meningitidis]
MSVFRINMTAATVLAALSSSVFAAQTADLETVHIKGQRSYNAIATEKNGDYSSFAATVGTKIPASLREIPQSVSIITNQQVKDRNVDTFDQLARKTPGLRVLSNDDGRSSVYARGYEYSEYNIDGLPAQMQSINGTLPNLFAFDRVEVMRGPSGLFDSSGEMGGIVNLVRKRPTKAFQGHAAAGFGTHKQYKAEADVSGSLNSDGSVRGRVMAQTVGASPRPAEKNNHHETFYAAADWDINPDTVLGAGYLYQQRHLAPYNGLPANADSKLPSLPQHAFVGADWNKFKMNSHDVFADLKHYFGNGGYGKVGMRYSDRDADSNYAFAGSKLGMKTPAGRPGCNTADDKACAVGLGTEIKQKALAFDASYSRPFALGNTANEFVIGADYNRFRSTNEKGSSSTVKSNIALGDFRSIPYVNLIQNARAGAHGYKHTLDTGNLDKFGVYGKFVFHPADGLSLIGGGRLGHYKIESGEGDELHKASKTKFTGYAGAVYDLNDNNSLYASFSQLYTPQTSLGTDGKLLKPRQGNQFEVGYKGSYMDDRLNTRVSFYRMKDKNAAAPLNPNNKKTRYAALGKRVMEGVETEISGAVTPKWQIHAGYSYLHSQIKTASNSRDDGIFLLMPKHSANLWTTYQVTPELTIGGGVNAMSGITSSAGMHAGGYATFDVMAAYRFTPKLKLQINADNIFNRHYYARVGGANTFNIPGSERSLTANLRYSF